MSIQNTGMLMFMRSTSERGNKEDAIEDQQTFLLQQNQNHLIFALLVKYKLRIEKYDLNLQNFAKLIAVNPLEGTSLSRFKNNSRFRFRQFPIVYLFK